MVQVWFPPPDLGSSVSGKLLLCVRMCLTGAGSCLHHLAAGRSLSLRLRLTSQVRQPSKILNPLWSSLRHSTASVCHSSEDGKVVRFDLTVGNIERPPPVGETGRPQCRAIILPSQQRAKPPPSARTPSLLRSLSFSSLTPGYPSQCPRTLYSHRLMLPGCSCICQKAGELFKSHTYLCLLLLVPWNSHGHRRVGAHL